MLGGIPKWKKKTKEMIKSRSKKNEDAPPK